MAQQLGHFFLQLHQCLGVFCPRFGLRQRSLQLDVLLLSRALYVRPRASPFGRHRIERTGVTFATPFLQAR